MEEKQPVWRCVNMNRKFTYESKIALNIYTYLFAEYDAKVRCGMRKKEKIRRWRR